MSQTESHTRSRYGSQSIDEFSLHNELLRSKKIHELRADTSWANGHFTDLPKEINDIVYKIERYEELNDINHVGTFMYGD
jgi:hypothetical protein